MLHVVRAAGFQVDQHRDIAAQSIKVRKIDRNAQSRSHGREMNQRIGRAADSVQHDECIGDRFRCEDIFRQQRILRHRHRASPGRLGVTKALGVHRRNRCGARQAHPGRFDHAGDGTGRAHHHAGAGRRCQLGVHLFNFSLIDFTGAIFGPESSAIGTCTEALTLVLAGQHRPGGNDDRGNIQRGRCHQLRRNGLVAAANQHHRIDWLRAHHFLGVQRHQVAQIHTGRMGKRFADGDGREDEWHAAFLHHAALYCLDNLRDIAVAGIEITVRVGDADDGAVQRVVGKAHRLDEGLTQE